MRVAYVDTSCLAAVAFGEPGYRELVQRLAGFDRLVSTNLLEAELRAALAREEVSASPDRLLANLSWLLPDRPLSEEFQRVLACGYVRGADLWHLATALYLAPVPGQLHFLTLDKRQGEVAAKLGFKA